MSGLILDASVSMRVTLGESSASADHLNASWMVSHAFGRIIENQRVSERHSLAVRNIWAASFGL